MAYSFKVGTTYQTTFGTRTWEKTVETDSIKVTLPELTASIDGDSQVDVGEDTEFDASGSDGYRGIDQFKWYVDGERVGGDTQTFEYEFKDPGTHTVKVEVSDYTWDLFGDHRWKSDSMTVDAIGDSDGDGIPNSDDECEDTEGEEEFDGCPDPDPDGDGVKNADDSCPDQAGELRNGCPNSKPSVGQIQIGDTVAVSETVSASVTASDPDGHGLQFSWSNGDTGRGTDFTFKRKGMKTVSVSVSDGYATVSKSIRIEVVESNTGGQSDNQTSDGSDGNQTDGPITDPVPQPGPIEKIFYGFIDFVGGVF